MSSSYVDEKTGLRYCSQCHTPMEAYFPNGAEILGRRTHPVLCRCRLERHERLQQEQQWRQQQEKGEKLRREAFADIPGSSWRFGSVPWTPQLQTASRYADQWERMEQEGRGLLLFGDVGTGKTYAAACIANALIDKGRSVRLVCLSDAVSRLQGLFGKERDEYLRSILKPSLLILDDLGAERSTSFGKEQVFDLINRRTLSGKPMIVTTNHSLAAMKQTKELQDRRIFDRILEVCVPVRFAGESYRSRLGAANLQQAAALLKP